MAATALRFTLPIVLLLFASGVGLAEGLRDAEPFSLSAKELQAAADKAGNETADAVILLEQTTYQVNDQVIDTIVVHRILKINEERGIEGWGEVSTGWAPWFQSKPTMEARVLDSKGSFHKLDPASIEIVAPTQGEDHTYSDWRQMRAPLPAVHTGSIIETVTIRKSSKAFSEGGDSAFLYLGAYSPTLLTRVTIDSDQKLDPRFYLTPKLSRTLSKKSGRHIYHYENGFIPGYEYEDSQPVGVPRVPTMAFSTSKSWKSLATLYAKTVDEQLVKGLPEDAFVPAKGSREQTIAATLRALHEHVRYSGLEFAENAIVPWTPAETWSRQYGDCKDKASVLVSMLRRAGIEAHVALLRSGFDFDVDPKLPAMNRFNHAIVYVPRSKGAKRDYWIDATAEWAVLGQLPASIQGRQALVAADSTRGLLRIPVHKARDNRIVETRVVTLPGYQVGAIEETSEYFGPQEMSVRESYIQQEAKEIQKNLASYMADHYQARAIKPATWSNPSDLGKPFRLQIKADEADTTFGGTHQAGIEVNRWGLFGLLDSDLMEVAREKEHLRSRIEARTTALRVFPSQKEWHYQVAIPKGFEVKTLPRDLDRKLGAVHFRQRFRVEGQSLQASFTVSLSKESLSAEEVNRTRAALAKFLDSAIVTMTLHHDAMSMWGENKSREAVAVLQKTIKQAGTTAAAAEERARLAQLLMQTGLNGEARKQISRANELAPTSQLVFELAAYTRERDDFGKWLAADADREGAKQAFTALLETFPDNLRLRENYTTVLLHARYDRPYSGELEAALPHLRALAEAKQPGYDQELVSVLLRLGRFDELAALDGESTPYQVAHLAAVYGQKGAKELERVVANTRMDAATRESITTALLGARMYPAARIVSEAGQSPSPLRALFDVQRYEQPRKLRGEKSLLLALLASELGKQKPPGAYLSRHFRGAPAWDEFLGNVRQSLPEALQGKTPVLMDVIAARLEVEVIERSGRYALLKMRVDKAEQDVVVETGARPRLLFDGGEDSDSLVRAVLATRKASEAKSLFAWTGAELETDGMDSYSSFYGRRIFKSLENEETLRRYRWSAASWMNGRDDEALLAIEDCAETGNVHCLEGLAAEHLRRRNGQAALKTLRTLEGKIGTDLPYGFRVARAWATLATDPVAGESMARALEVHKTGRLAFSRDWLISEALLAQNKYDEAFARQVEILAKDGMANGNNMAWLGLFTAKPDLDESLRLIRSELEGLLQNEDGSRKNITPGAAASKHTEATILAAMGRNQEALQAVNASRLVRSEPSDYLVYGRVAANLGLRQAAEEAYRRVIAAEEKDDGPMSSAKLAQRWLAQLESEGAAQ